MRRIGLAGHWAYRAGYRSADEVYGLGKQRLLELYRSCDALLNVCGATVLNDDQMRARRRVYVETDPVTNQLELASGKEKTRAVLAAHDLLVTYGENYGRSGLRRPDGRPSLPEDAAARGPRAVALRLRFPAPGATPPSATGSRRATTSSGTARPTVEQAPRVPEVPRSAAPQARPRLRAVAEPGRRCRRERLTSHGWRLASPLRLSLEPFGYQEIFRRSRAQWTWPRTRTCACAAAGSASGRLLPASGKPVVSQSTGFENVLPTGGGLFAFRTMDQALAAIDSIGERLREGLPRRARGRLRAPRGDARLPQVREDIGL